MKSVLEESFEATVEEKNIQGEQFDLVVMKNGDHILIEIAASVRRNILERLDRKKALYISEVGIVPARIILAVGTINSRSAQIIRDAPDSKSLSLTTTSMAKNNASVAGAFFPAHGNERNAPDLLELICGFSVGLIPALFFAHPNLDAPPITSRIRYSWLQQANSPDPDCVALNQYRPTTISRSHLYATDNCRQYPPCHRFFPRRTT